jgi:signal transduction histidine kinase
MSATSIDPQVLLRLQQLAAVGEMGAGVCHETRNLLTAITGFTQIAKQRASDPEALLRYIGLIEREALRCVEVLEQFLDLSRTATELEPVDIAKVVEHVASAAIHQIGLQRITLRLEVAAMPAVRGRRGELQQVVLNLAINAMHATPTGGEIVITAQQVGTSIEIAVTDTGPGVPPELRDKIFDAFFTTKQGTGTGLGLALCRRIVAAHGGTLELDTAYARGARFVVRLPVA